MCSCRAMVAALGAAAGQIARHQLPHAVARARLPWGPSSSSSRTWRSSTAQRPGIGLDQRRVEQGAAQDDPVDSGVEANRRAKRRRCSVRSAGGGVTEAHLDGREVQPGGLPRDHEPGRHDELGRVSGQRGGVAPGARASAAPNRPRRAAAPPRRRAGCDGSAPGARGPRRGSRCCGWRSRARRTRRAESARPHGCRMRRHRCAAPPRATRRAPARAECAHRDRRGRRGRRRLPRAPLATSSPKCAQALDHRAHGTHGDGGSGPLCASSAMRLGMFAAVARSVNSSGACRHGRSGSLDLVSGAIAPRRATKARINGCPASACTAGDHR